MTEEQPQAQLQCARFAILEKPFCVWEWDLAKRNLEFISGLDPDYFKYLGERLAPDLETEQKQRAAIALRLAYRHGLETFLAILFGAAQAGDCLAGWLHRYQLGDLRGLCDRARWGGHFPNRLSLKRCSFSALANAMLSFRLEDEDRDRQVKEGFGGLWQRFAVDFLNEQQIREYNSLKHGLRLRPGGFTLRFGSEDTPGVPPPPEKMHSLGGSEFGSTFILPEPIGALKNHFRLKESHLNWVPANHVAGLELLSMSTRNVIAFLKGALERKWQEAQFTWPTPQEAFFAPWAASPGTTSYHSNLDLSEEDIRVLTDEEIMEIYKLTPHDGPSPES